MQPPTAHFTTTPWALGPEMGQKVVPMKGNIKYFAQFAHRACNTPTDVAKALNKGRWGELACNLQETPM